MRAFDLDELPEHSPWARYLLDPTDDPPGDPEAYTSVDAYDEMYAHVLEEYRSASTAPQQFVRQIYAKGREDPGPISMDEELYLASPAELRERDGIAVREALAGVESDPSTVVDLGCGYGSALAAIADAFSDATVVGGEYSPHGVELARALHSGVENVQVEKFDFHGAWDLLDAASGDTLVFTRGALTTLPELDEVVDRFGRRASGGNVIGGVHLEQVDIHPETTLGLLRRRYGRVRGYTGELLAVLDQHSDIDVADVSYDVLGSNPLHPRTMIRWRAK
jgi:SAM-dependent methyltransferase